MILALLLVATAADPQQTPRRMDVSVWAVAGYDRASGSGGATPAVESGFGFDVGGHALYRVAAAFAVGALADRVALRVQGTWEHSSYTVLQNPGVLVDVSATVWALLGGLALHF